ncbi:MAG: DUF3553 domain-containing protein [Roseinatronobacter sp.]
MTNARGDHGTQVLIGVSGLPCAARSAMTGFMSHLILSPGMFVRHPQHPEWGVGQVQSRIGEMVTVSFVEAGKQVINGSKIALILVSDAEL